MQMLCSKSEGSRVRERGERTNRESSHRGEKEEKYQRRGVDQKARCRKRRSMSLSPEDWIGWAHRWGSKSRWWWRGMLVQ
jgi:hypothetical protein